MIDKATVKSIQTDLMEAAKFIERRYGVTMHCGGGTYTPSTFKMKIQFVSKTAPAAKAISDVHLANGYAPVGTVVNHRRLGNGIITKRNRVNYIVKFENERVLYKVAHYSLLPGRNDTTTLIPVK